LTALTTLLNSATSLAFAKTPLAFTITFAGYVVFFAGVIVSISCVSGYTKARTSEDLQGVFATLVIGFIATAFALLSITQTGEIKRILVRSARFSELCPTAKLEINKTVTGVNSIFIDPDFEPVFMNHSANFGIVGDSFLNSDYIKSFEVLNRDDATKTGKKYLHLSKGATPGARIRLETNDLQSQYAMTTTQLTSEWDKKLGISGAEMVVSNRVNGEQLAKLRYFWSIENYNQFCPSFDGTLFPSSVTLYVLGLGPESVRDQIKKEFHQWAD
jgi:hypothetical protein